MDDKQDARPEELEPEILGYYRLLADVRSRKAADELGQAGQGRLARLAGELVGEMVGEMVEVCGRGGV